MGEERQSYLLRQQLLHETEREPELSQECNAESEHPMANALFRLSVGLPGKVSQHVSHDADPPSSLPECEEADQDPGAESCSYSFLYLSH